MECVRVKELLSEYLDGRLGPEITEPLEEHLSSCPECAGELASLRRLIRGLGSMEPVRPPADFLEQIHGRLEEPSGLRKLLRRFFVPFRVKIPLQLATAALTGVLVFAVFHSQVAERPITETLSPPRVRKSLDGIGAKQDKAPPEQESVRAGTVMNEAFRAGEAGEKKQPPAPALIRAGRSSKDAGQPLVPLTLTVRFNKQGEEEPARREQAPGAPRVSELKAWADREDRAPPPAGEETPTTFSFDDLKRLIAGDGGRILRVEYDPDTGRPSTVLGEIPTGRYSAFLRRLGEIATFSEPLPDIPDRERESLLLRIHIRKDEG
ncbi:MAG: zf-HC2 domain-containing protein [Deltaproteobacteria bacterium]|nr:zf-HC2 domain-containing protein [Deltaproteobacteria bacterium]